MRSVACCITIQCKVALGCGCKQQSGLTYEVGCFTTQLYRSACFMSRQGPNIMSQEDPDKTYLTHKHRLPTFGSNSSILAAACRAISCMSLPGLKRKVPSAQTLLARSWELKLGSRAWAAVHSACSSLREGARRVPRAHNALASSCKQLTVIITTRPALQL